MQHYSIYELNLREPKIPRFFRDLLDRYEDLKYDLRRNLSKQKQLLELCDFPKKADYKLFVDNGQNGSKVENLAIAIQELAKKATLIQEEIASCLARMQSITAKIERRICGRIIEERLIYKKSWQQISDETFYTRGHLYKILQDGIASLEKMIRNDTQ